jgi:glycosyltransferase involved in cell wall biosynthesis
LKILFINTSPFLSGAEVSILQLLQDYDQTSTELYIVLPRNVQYDHLFPKNAIIIKMPLIWFNKSFNPFYIIKCLISILYVTIRLSSIIRNERIKIIYSNTGKSFLYVAFIKLFIRDCKLICHIRDKIKSKIINRILTRQSDKIICVSNYIYNQIQTCDDKKQLILCGVKTNTSHSFKNNILSLKKQLGLSQNIILVVQIGQLTRWKNHLDYIKTAKIILQKNPNVYFLIVGDDLSGRENKYKQELIKFVEQLNLSTSVSFLDHQDDLKELISQIDILVHPAINEPFGRVLIEAMAMEKPVVAYNCGGPKEVIVNGETGYLVKPYDTVELANKTINLIENSELRAQFGKAGKKRVAKEFNIKRYVKEMTEVFENI